MIGSISVMANPLSKLKKFFGLGGRAYSYEEAREVLEKENAGERMNIARQESTKPEILYYLAEDEKAEIRRQVAANGSTPIQANQALTDDADDEVRFELARKIARLVPGIPPGEARDLREQMIDILDILASDQLPRVRAIIAEEIKHSANVPKGLVDKLAKDLEETVSQPILEYSPLLNDSDLKEIIVAGAARGALQAIARRAGLSEKVADALANSLEIPALVDLLTNKNASINEETLERIILLAKQAEELHEPLVLRPNLSIRIIRRIAGFVASSLVHDLLERNNVDDSVADEILANVRMRLDEESIEGSDDSVLSARAEELRQSGELSDAFIIRKIQSGERRLVAHSLATMADLEYSAIEVILKSNNGKAVTALAWKAGLKMRTAIIMQTRLAHVPGANVIQARDGIDYPFPVAELAREISFFQ